MNYANIWKNKSRDENTNLMLVVDPHSPPIFRVNGALKNIDEAKINTLTVMIMQVPCCSGLMQMAKVAMDNASRKVPLKAIEFPCLLPLSS